MKECTCSSYNRPDLGGGTPSVIMKSKFVKEEGVCVDACIAPIVQKLWDNEIGTQSSCCGHNGKFGRTGAPSIVVHQEDAQKALELTGGEIEIYSWKLIQEETH